MPAGTSRLKTAFLLAVVGALLGAGARLLVHVLPLPPVAPSIGSGNDLQTGDAEAASPARAPVVTTARRRLVEALEREERRLTELYGVPPDPPPDLDRRYRDAVALRRDAERILQPLGDVRLLTVDCEPFPCFIAVRHPKDVDDEGVFQALEAGMDLETRRLGGGESLMADGDMWWSAVVMPDAELSTEEERYLQLRGAQILDRGEDRSPE